MDAPLKFEILAIDKTEESEIQTKQNLLYSLLSNSFLWKGKDASLGHQNWQINCESLNVKVNQLQPTTESNEEISYVELGNTFSITVTGSYDLLEPMRIIIIKFLKDRGFKDLYILVDEVSREIAYQIYPLIYQVENLLRAFLVKDMTRREGTNWLDKIWKEMEHKMEKKKKNEIVFGKHIDNRIYLFDFGELGQNIYTHSSGFITKEDIIRKVSELDETPEAIKKLKNEVQTNYQKFFKESFKDKHFQQKWEELEKIRHKVAHNNLFTHDDLTRSKSLFGELMTIIDTAMRTLPTEQLGLEGLEAKEKESNLDLIDITEDEFLKQLREEEEYYSELGGFVSLSRFIQAHLESQKYSVSSAYKLVQELKSQGKIELYKVDNPYNQDKQTTAIRIVREQTD
jgi:hypothetical protein